MGTPDGPLPGERLPHAVLDLPSRNLKAMKIERLLELDALDGPLRMLEVGTGSGGIAHYFGTHPSRRFAVDAVDVVDNRLVREGFRFELVADTQLPFDAGSFDVVLSNHVIEHVGDAAARRRHLAELARVLTPAGRAYLAVPSRWMLVEPHYRLAFLSWLPVRWRTPYLRWRGRGSEYDCNPPGPREFERELRATGWQFRQHAADAVRAMAQLEPAGPLLRLAAALPAPVWDALRHTLPTLIYTLRKPGAAAR